jgi:cytochrome c5
MMKRMWIVMAGCASLGVTAASYAQDAPSKPQVEVKDGPGKEVFLAKCTACHALQDVLAQRNNRVGWENKVREMVSLGASLSNEDVKTITEYLAKQYGF